MILFLIPDRCNFVIKKLLLVLAFTSSQLFADISGKVTKVMDGDTIIVTDDAGISHKIRLLGIDAPESKQVFGDEATAYLSKKLLNKILRVAGSDKDRYGRLLGKLIYNSEDINLDLVAQGMAWHYKKYQNTQALKDQFLYSNAEIHASENKLGVWQESNPIPPWEWRRDNK